MEYVPEPAELDDGMDEEFRKIFSQLSFRETTATQVKGIFPCPFFLCNIDFKLFDFPLGEVWAWHDALIILPIQDNDNKDELAENVASTKKVDSNSEEEEQDNPQKEKGVSNKKKKVYMTC